MLSTHHDTSRLYEQQKGPWTSMERALFKEAISYSLLLYWLCWEIDLMNWFLDVRACLQATSPSNADSTAHFEDMSSAQPSTNSSRPSLRRTSSECSECRFQHFRHFVRRFVRKLDHTNSDLKSILGQDASGATPVLIQGNKTMLQFPVRLKSPLASEC